MRNNVKQWFGMWGLLTLTGFIISTLAYFIKGAIGLLKGFRTAFLVVPDCPIITFFLWMSYTVVLCMLSVAWTFVIAKQAAGSGIPEIRTILSGALFNDYLTLRTLIAKAGGLVFGVGSGMPLGSEGPYAHMAATVGNLLCNFGPYKAFAQDQSTRNMVMTAACSAGVGACFGTPFGGMLFSVETTATYIPLSTYWRSLFSTVIGAITLRLWAHVNLFAPTASLAAADMGLSEARELPLFLMIGICCGVLGACFVHFHDMHTRCRKQLGLHNNRAFSHLVFPLVFSMVVGVLSCPLVGGHGMSLGPTYITELVTAPVFLNSYAYMGLALYAVAHFFLTALVMCVPVPCGVYYPCLNIGAALGRLMGEILRDTFLPNCDPRMYAIIGAAGFSVGVTRTISTIIIILELTQQTHLTIPILASVMAAYIVGQRISPSIFECVLRLRGLPYLPTLPAFRTYSEKAGDIMQAPNIVLLENNTTFASIQNILGKLTPGELDAVPLAEALYGTPDLQLRGTVPVVALEAVYDAVLCHAGCKVAFAADSVYDVQIASVKEEDYQGYRISVGLHNTPADDQGLLTLLQQSFIHNSFRNDFDRLPSTVSEPYSEPNSKTPCTTRNRKSIHLGGSASLVTRAPANLTLNDFSAAQVVFDPAVVCSPFLLMVNQPFRDVHDLFTTMGLNEACVQKGGILLGLLTRADIIKVVFGE
eukprot:NODE_138_length_2236_cov_294.285780_g113_i0.p1 GENE.NODE_138_length_2236_cov_294.285780_g113_i0~~NODE_138_length_2236_cov_294.285780_g113_i0.p1  ORF type:complete len:703 (+),score=132.00 NODE_138_length_2236_cov_294.285780_g113_i0:85-2193(+)